MPKQVDTETVFFWRTTSSLRSLVKSKQGQAVGWLGTGGVK